MPPTQWRYSDCTSCKLLQELWRLSLLFINRDGPILRDLTQSRAVQHKDVGAEFRLAHEQVQLPVRRAGDAHFCAADSSVAFFKGALVPCACVCVCVCVCARVCLCIVLLFCNHAAACQEQATKALS